MEAIAQMASMALPCSQQGLCLFTRFRLDAPFFKAGYRHCGVESFQLMGLLFHGNGLRIWVTIVRQLRADYAP
jgi:hypothetical protein